MELSDLALAKLGFELELDCGNNCPRYHSSLLITCLSAWSKYKHGQGGAFASDLVCFDLLSNDAATPISKCLPRIFPRTHVLLHVRDGEVEERNPM